MPLLSLSCRNTAVLILFITSLINPLLRLVNLELAISLVSRVMEVVLRPSTSLLLLGSKFSPAESEMNNAKGISQTQMPKKLEISLNEGTTLWL